jgi:predicted O-methyltransferase YrrM
VTVQRGMSGYEREDQVPPLVWSAVASARARGGQLACLPEVGRLLQVLAGTATGKRIAELGTGFGVGAAWILSGMTGDTELVSVEIDAARARVAGDVLSVDRRVRVVAGDWQRAQEWAPYAMVFSDGGPKHEPDAPELLAPLLGPGGLVLLDDFTPCSAWTSEQRRLWQDDPTRRLWLRHPRYRCVELQLGAQVAVLLAVLR